MGLVDNDGFNDGSLDGSTLMDGNKLDSDEGCEDGIDDGSWDGLLLG